jgi:hypothetical protein
MRRFIGWTVVVLVCFVALVTASTVFGRVARANDNWYTAYPFTYANGMPCPQPCMFGIRPGITPYTKVREMLAMHPLTHRISRKEIVTYSVMQYFSNKATIYLGIDQTVQWIEFVETPMALREIPTTPEQLARKVSMGETIAFGTPQSIQLMRDQFAKAATRAYYNDGLLVISHSRRDPATVADTDKLYAISVFRSTAPTPTIVVTPQVIGIARLVRWQGYGAASLYTDNN